MRLKTGCSCALHRTAKPRSCGRSSRVGGFSSSSAAAIGSGVGVFGGPSQEGWVLDQGLAAPPEPATEPPVPQREPTPTPIYVLKITGLPPASFLGHCVAVDALGAENKVEFKGFIPKAYRFTTDAILCTVQKWDARGRLEVGLRRQGKLIAYMDTAANSTGYGFSVQDPGAKPAAFAATTRRYFSRARAIRPSCRRSSHRWCRP